MANERAEFEELLRSALRPVDPPSDLIEKLESHLLRATEFATAELDRASEFANAELDRATELAERATEFAASELDGVDRTVISDPRNWVRPAAAVVVGASAGAALFVLRGRLNRK